MKVGSMLHFVEFLLFQFSITAFSGLFSRSSYSDIFRFVSVRNNGCMCFFLSLISCSSITMAMYNRASVNKRSLGLNYLCVTLLLS